MPSLPFLTFLPTTGNFPTWNSIWKTNERQCQIAPEMKAQMMMEVATLILKAECTKNSPLTSIMYNCHKCFLKHWLHHIFSDSSILHWQDYPRPFPPTGQSLIWPSLVPLGALIGKWIRDWLTCVNDSTHPNVYHYFVSLVDVLHCK